MERNLSLENRLSFNRPIAESTFRASISNSSFQWGGRKNLNNSVMNRSSAKSPVRERTGLNKIDARIYADVQSRGLTSRIVKYQESGNRLNRSCSMNNLLNESKQFPAIRTTKPELPYKATKQNVSMTHIAPPDKSAFYGNTLSGLLRSSSVITLQHSDDDISSENRPIIHPPVTEKELQPTRSVLEVLKEISRKRINNEDADETDTSKKYCNRADGDMNGSIPPDYRNIIQTPQAYKRQRESATECFNSSRLEQNAYLLKPPQNRQEASSPEQRAKRRHCNYNNDITSSLSSSKASNNKRKLFEHEGEKQQEKQLRYQPEIRLPELSTALNYVAKTPITPLPNTPQTGLSHSLSPNEIPLPVPVEKSVSSTEKIENSISKPKTLPEKPKLTLFNKNYESNTVEPLDERTVDVEDDAYAGIQFIKPKKSASAINGSASSLLIERTQKSKLALMLSGLRGELYLGDEEDKPVEAAQKKTEEKPNNSTAEPLKANTTDNNKTTNKATVFSIVPTTLPTNAPTIATTAQPTLTTTIDLTNTTIKPNTNVVDSPAATTTVFSLPTTKPTTATSPTKISSPLTGIKLTPQTTSAVATSISTAAPIASVAPTFSFGIATAIPATSTTNSVVSKATTMILPNKAPMPNNTSTNTPFSIGMPTQTATTSAPTSQSLLPTFAEATAQPKLPVFTMKPAATASITGVTTSTTASTLPSAFSFNSNSTSIAVPASNAVTTTQPTAATLPIFAFGGAPQTQTTTNAAVSTTTEHPKTTTTATTPFSFGANKSTGGFSFAANVNTSTTNAPAATEAPKMFSFASPKTSTAAGGFSFNGTTENKSTTANVFGNNAIVPINFGASATTAQQQQQNTPSALPTTKSNFNFGGKPADAAAQDKMATPNTFGALVGNNQSQPFSFGAAANTTTTTAEAPKSNNIFSLPSNANAPFSFGGSTANTTTASAATTNTFSLARNNNNNNNNQSNLFSFGGSNAGSNGTSTAEAAKPNNTLSFGSNTQSKPFSFGGATNEAPKPTFGSEQNKPFSFGAANNTIATTDATKSGGNTFNFSTTNQNNTFSFAGAGAGNKPNITEPTAMVAPNNASTNTFTFGATKPQLTQSNTFGAASNGQQNVFSFAASNNNSAAPNASNTKPTFNAFSGNAQGNSFTFGSGNNAVASATPPAAAVKPTTFGVASNNATQSSAFMFGGGSNNNNAAAAAPTGNLFAMPSNVNNNNNPPPPFGAAPGTTGPSASPNIFAASPSSDRPIRRATRRLTKF